MTPRILIIAYGNPLRCDDGLPWHAAQKLSKLNLRSDVEILTRRLLTPELALPVSQAATVLFIGAAQTGVPGELASGLLIPQRQSSLFTHEFSPATILSVAQELYGKCPEAFLDLTLRRMFRTWRDRLRESRRGSAAFDRASRRIYSINKASHRPIRGCLSLAVFAIPKPLIVRTGHAAWQTTS